MFVLVFWGGINWFWVSVLCLFVCALCLGFVFFFDDWVGFAVGWV